MANLISIIDKTKYFDTKITKTIIGFGYISFLHDKQAVRSNWFSSDYIFIKTCSGSNERRLL